MIRTESGVIWVIIGLFLFGVAYNAFVGWTQRRGYEEGYTAILVVIGVLVTLAGVAIIDWSAARITAFAFIASGSPMIAGSIWRHVRARERAIRAIIQEVK